MLKRIKYEIPRGFLGAAKKSTKAPYREIERKPEHFPYGKDSFFITPPTEEERNKYKKGIKR